MLWRKEDSCPVSLAPERICQRLSRFCNILLQDLTPLHVKITSSTSLLSVCQKKHKLSTYLHIVSYNHISFLTRSYQLGWVLALSSQWRIQGRGPGPPFFGRPPAHPLFSRFGSGSGSGFYSITWRTIARSAGYKIHFGKKLLFRGNFFPCRCDIFRFFEFILFGYSSTAPVFSYNQINKEPGNR